MKTYEMNNYRYWFDNSYVQMWTIHKIDANGYQIGDAEYYNKAGLLANYPWVKFSAKYVVN